MAVLARRFAHAVIDDPNVVGPQPGSRTSNRLG